jgi:DNA polymerase-4
MERRIAHLDMDAFYASVELLRRPQLRGLPVVVGGRRLPPPRPGEAHARLADYVGRGVVTTATYEARAFGVHSGMGLMKAAALCPRAVLLPADFEEYARMSRLFKAAVREIAPSIEDRGIDEIYIDLGAHAEETVDLARRIKAAVRHATGLDCSIGIAPNKLLAKIASELDKPDGLTQIGAPDVPRRVWPLPVRKLHGVGPSAAAKLAALGIATIGELARAAPELLAARFGRRYGEWLSAAARGRDDRPLVLARAPKSVSRETTFERDLHPRHDRAELSQALAGLCERLAADLQRKRWRSRTIGIKLRYGDFRCVTRDLTLAEPTADAAQIRAAARACLRRVPLDRALRLLGVRAGTLLPDDGAIGPGEPPAPATLPLFR